MFCTSCGSEIDGGAKFCMKCGTAVNAVSARTEPITATPQAAPVQQSSAGASGKNNLIRIAAFVAIGLWFIGLVVMFFSSKTVVENSPFLKSEYSIVDFLWDIIEGEMIGPPVSLFSLPIPIVLSLLGWKKNNRIMVLIAGITYIFPSYCIPSGIMCIIAFRKMKKPA